MEFSIHGGISPYLDIELSGGERVIAESGALLAKEPSVAMSSTMSGGFAGAFKRVLAGTSLFVVEYAGPGQVTLTHGRTGRIVPLDLDGTREQFRGLLGLVQIQQPATRGLDGPQEAIPQALAGPQNPDCVLGRQQRPTVVHQRSLGVPTTTQS